MVCFTVYEQQFEFCLTSRHLIGSKYLDRFYSDLSINILISAITALIEIKSLLAIELAAWKNIILVAWSKTTVDSIS